MSSVNNYTANALRRIVVGLKDHSNSKVVKVPGFVDCIVDHFSPNGISAKVGYILENNTLVLFPSEAETQSGTQELNKFFIGTYHPGCLHLQHSPECPVKRLREEPEKDAKLIDESKVNQGIFVAVAIVVESSDSHILLTQRADQMRSFPKTWVPPGGNVEFGENLLDAVLRELYEETGLFFPSNSDIKVLCLWESVYPILFALGYPRNHHIVIYYHLLSAESRAELQDKIKIDPEEVQAWVWLSEENVFELWFGNGKSSVKSYILKPNKEPQETSLQLDSLYVSRDLFIESGIVMNGSQLVMLRWLELKQAHRLSKM